MIGCRKSELQIMANRTHLVVMPGDGIGPEIMAATLHVLREVDRSVALGLTFEEVPIGSPALKAHGSTLPDSSFEAGKRADGVILGPVSHNDYLPVAQGGLNPSGEMRKRLDLFATIRPARCASGLISLPTSVRRNRGPACRRAAANRSTSWWCARTPRASTPTAT